MVLRIILIVNLFLFLISCKNEVGTAISESDTRELVMYVAAGFRPALEMIEKNYSDSNSLKFQKNYASSGTLARQLANGATCDIFISANRQWINFLTEKELLDSASVQIIARNSLVVIAPINSKIEPPEFNAEFDVTLKNYDRIAIGNPNFVPVGRYSKMVLDSLNWYKPLSGNFIMCKDVSSVRHFVELGECDWGIVYYSEAILSQKVKIVSEIPKELHKPIFFYMARLQNGDVTLFENFLDFVSSDKGKSILENKGFYGTQ